MRLSTIAALRIGFVLVCAAPAFFACGGSTPPPEPPPAPTASATEPAASATPPPPATASAAPADTSSAVASAAPPPPAAPKWKDMNKDQRKDYMKNVVMPKVKEDFAALNAKKYGDMTCATCHGDGAKDGSFKMPNPKLPKLDPTGGFKKHMDKHADVTKFMMQKLTPHMAELVDEPVYNPETKTGFGCAECHVMNMPSAPATPAKK